MQTEVVALPVVSSDGCKPLIRKNNKETRISSSTNGKNQSASKSAAILLSKRKQLHPLFGGPCYKNNARINTLSDPSKSSNRNPVGERILSAKMLRVKQLQNQLTDAHCHINELANENRLLKALQKRQDSALRRYEGSNAELPRIINSHHEELRVLQTKYKKLKAQHKNTCDLLKEKENELHNLQAQNKHLLQLSKDRNLGEREKLQAQVSDLNHRIEEQDDTIQLLHRRLALESKSLRHQLNSEVAKHKETQRHLTETTEKMKALEELLDNREKKMYQSGQLPIFGKRKNIASQSLTNLADASNATHLIKSIGKARNMQNHNSQDKSLPILTEYETAAKSKLSDTSTNFSLDSLSVSQKTETMTSLELVRKFRLQKSPHARKLSARERLRERSRDVEVKSNENNENYSRLESVRKSYESHDRQDASGYRTGVVKSEDDVENGSSGDASNLPRELLKELGYSSGESDDGTVPFTEREEYGVIDPTIASKELHAKLTSKSLSNTQTPRHEETEEEEAFMEEELDRYISDKLKFKRGSVAQILPKRSYVKPNSKAEMRQFTAVPDIHESDSETDKELELQREQDKYNFILTNAPNDSDNDDPPHHPIEEFLKFDINQSGSDSETETQNRRRNIMKINKLGDSNVSKSTDGKTSKSTEDEHESGKQRLMDISKSWSELQEKIMREREASECQIKALESELEDEIVLGTKKTLKCNANEIEESLKNANQTLPFGGKDELQQNMQQTLLQVDKRGEVGSNLRRHSISQDGMNSKGDANEQARKNEPLTNKSFEYKLLQRRQSTLEMTKHQIVETPINRTSFSRRSDSDDHLRYSLGRELNDINTTQAKIESMVSELNEENNDSRHHKSSSITEIPTRLSDTSRMDDIERPINAQQEPESTRQNTVQRDATYKEKMSAEAKISFNKERLLAAMKAIDNNDNVEFLDLQKSQRSGGSSRSQITENLYRGIPTHTKKKDDLIKELFGDGKGDTKARNGCTKLH